MFDERESAKFELAADLAELEKRLARLTLAPPRVDRDALMFAAGQAAERGGSTKQGAWRGNRWLWPAATATMTAATIFLAVMLVWQPEQRSGDLPVVVAQDTAKPPAASAAEIDVAPVRRDTWPWASRPTSGYLGLRYTALTRGIGAIEREFQSAGNNGGSLDGLQWVEPATVRRLLDELLPQATRQTESRS